MLGLYREWIDAEQLARRTPRIALAGPVSALQAFRRQAESIHVPACLDGARVALVKLTTGAAEGYLAFLGKDGLKDMVWSLLERGPAIESFERAVSTADCSDQASTQ